MKIKTPLFLTVLFLAEVATAQKIGVNAGLTLPSYKISAGDVSLASGIKPGFTVGVFSSFALNSHLSFRPGLNFVRKGGNLKDDGDNTHHSVSYNYLELPFNFVYNVSSLAGKFFIGGGPSVSFGLSGKYKITGMYEESGDVKFGFGEDDDLKPLEMGLNLLAGFQFKKGFIVSGGYNLGLNNISGDGDLKFHNRYFAIRVGYAW